MAVAAILVAACDEPTTTAVEAVPSPVLLADLSASPGAGGEAFVAECASCHSSHDGFDLAFFSMPDSTVVRRAVFHVDSATAFDIAAYIATLPDAQGFDPVPRDERVFQPGGMLASSDLDFAEGLFGGDGWPAELTSDDLASVDLAQVPVAVEFPLWSEEQSNLDWMPGAPVPDDILAFMDGRLAQVIDLYHDTGADWALNWAVQGLRVADRQRDSQAAPCIVDDPVLFRPEECFELRRWTSSLLGQHLLRNSDDDGRAGDGGTVLVPSVASPFRMASTAITDADASVGFDAASLPDVVGLDPDGPAPAPGGFDRPRPRRGGGSNGSLPPTDSGLDPRLTDIWWDIGNAARRSLQHGMPIDNADENWAVWMYMSFVERPERHASVYLAGGLRRMELPRHATFTALRSQVARLAERGEPYKDLSTAVRHAPPHWLENVARFGYVELLERLEAGDIPSAESFNRAPNPNEPDMPDSHLEIAWEGLNQAEEILDRRPLSAEVREELKALHAQVEALLPEL